MGLVKNFISRFGILGKLLSFLWKRKKWWLIPLIIILVIFGLLMIFAGSTGLAPFIYPLF